MTQALLFINDATLNAKVTADGGLADRLVKAGKSDGEILDTLYWTALGRAPSAAERTADLAGIHQATAPSSAPTPVAPTVPAKAATTATAPAKPTTTAASPAKAPTTVPLPAKPTTAGSPPTPGVTMPTATTATTVAAKTTTAPAQNELRRRAFEDMLWVLINSKEFLFNH